MAEAIVFSRTVAVGLSHTALTSSKVMAIIFWMVSLISDRLYPWSTKVLTYLRGRPLGLPVLLESIKQYAPEAFIYLRGPEKVIGGYENCRLIFGEARNFGDDYNEVIDDALRYAQGCIVCNDDVVLTPTSYQRLLEDADEIKEQKREQQRQKFAWESTIMALCNDDLSKFNDILKMPVVF